MLSGDDPQSLAESLLLNLQERGLQGATRDTDRSLPDLPHSVGKPNPEREVWAVAETLRPDEGEPATLRLVSLELAGEAARISAEAGGAAAGVLIGHAVEPLAQTLSENGTVRVYLADSPDLKLYTAETYAWVLARAIEQYKPWAVLLPATSFGRDLAPRIAARLGLGLTGDCIGLEVDDQSRLLQLKPAFGGQVVAPIISSTLPTMATLRPGMLQRYKADVIRRATLIPLNTDGLPAPRVKIVATNREGEAGLALDNAKLVVCVGTGIGGPEALGDVQRLASELGAWMGLAPREIAIGGTRKVIDEGWLPHQQQIGITGHIVAPDLYLGIGVQGTFQPYGRHSARRHNRCYKQRPTGSNL